MTEGIHHPHDSLFRVSMSNLKVAKDLLKAHLPATLVRLIDWNTLELTNKSYVDQHLKHFLSDMVYRCTISGKKAYIYLLIEQQTEPYPLLPFKVLEYDVMICREHIRQGHKQLPLVANLVLYSGKKTPYPYSLDIYDCFQEADMARAMMFKPLELVDLGQAHEEELVTHGSADMLELLLRQGREGTFLEWIDKDPDLVNTLAERAYWKSGLMYMLDREQKYEGEELVKKLEFINPSKKGDIMQAVRTIRQKSELIGEKRGEKRGIQTERIRLAKTMLSKLHMDVDTVRQATGLTHQELDKLTKELN